MGDRILKINMLGGFSMAWKDGEQENPVVIGYSESTKLIQLLISILNGGEKGTHRQVLLDRFYETEFVEDPSGTLRVNIHRLRKYLKSLEGLEDKDIIQTGGGFYYWDRREVPLELDIEVFRDLAKQMEAEEDMDRQAQLALEACAMYRGEYLESLGGEEWVATLSAGLQKLYFKCLGVAAAALEDEGKYEELLELYLKTVDIYPYEEYFLGCIDCYMELNRFKEAMDLYERATSFYFEELGLTPSEEMLKRFREMSNKVHFKASLIDDIRNGLAEDMEKRGAYYCSYPGFSDCFHMVCRMNERSGQSAFLMLITLFGRDGRPMEDKEKTESCMELLKDTVGASLRRGDVYTRYGTNQCLLLLVGLKQEDCILIQKRIESKFFGTVTRARALLDFHVQAAVEKDLQGERMRFSGDTGWT